MKLGIRTKIALGACALMAALPAAPARAAGPVQCINDHWWAGEADKSYECAGEAVQPTIDCVNDHWWAGEIDKVGECAISQN